MRDFKERVVKGGAAKLCAQAANFALRIGALMVLARLLNPRDFGLVGMVAAITGVLNLLRDFGLSSAAVQRVEITHDQSSTLFWINVIVGAILCVSLVALAPLIVDFYREPKLYAVTVALSPTFLINALGIQHWALLQRQMRFTTLAAIDFVSLVFSVLVGIGMALNGYGYWALVGMTLTVPTVFTVALWLKSKWVPGMPRLGAGTSSMMRFGGTVTLNSVVVYAAYNLEKVLLGRYWGPEAIGLYGRSYQLISIPTENLNSAIGEVAFPALSRLQQDPVRFRNYFLKGYSLVLALTIPVTVAFAMFSNELILVVLGPKWEDAAPIFRLLAPTILVFAIINPLGWLMMALGLVGRSLRVAFVLCPLVIAGYVMGLPYGPKGVAMGYSCMLALWLIPHVVWCVQGTPISTKDIARAIAKPLASVVVAAAAVLLLQFYLFRPFSPLLDLLCGVFVLMTIYVGLLLFVMQQKAVYLDLFHELKRRAPPNELTSVSTVRLK